MVRPSLIVSPLLLIASFSLPAQTTPPAAPGPQAPAAATPEGSPFTANISVTTK